MLETAFRILKVSVIVAVASIFMIAINGLVNLVVSIALGGIVAEIFGVISCCLPFNASIVFGAIFQSTVAILSFLIAKKIFDLTSWSVSAI